MIDAAVARPLIDPPWMTYARSKIGQHEIYGDKDNPYIVECHRDAGLGAQHDELPWCGSFMNKCMLETGHSRPKQAAAARSWLHSDYAVRLQEPVHGCINVYSRPPDPIHAHVGIYDATVPHLPTYDSWDTLGGNEDNQVKVKPYLKDRLLGSFWPKSYPLPEGARLWMPAAV